MAFSSKTESEKIDVGFDCSAIVLGSITIASAVITVEKSYGTALANTLTLTGSPTINGKSVLQRIEAGIENNRYLIICKITTSVGEVFEVSECISVIEPEC